MHRNVRVRSKSWRGIIPEIYLYTVTAVTLSVYQICVDRLILSTVILLLLQYTHVIILEYKTKRVDKTIIMQ
jgi:hypothetical protein